MVSKYMTLIKSSIIIFKSLINTNKSNKFNISNIVIKKYVFK